MAGGPSACSWGPTWGAWSPGNASASTAPPTLARSETHTPLLPCGLTAEELACITAVAETHGNRGEGVGSPSAAAGTPAGTSPAHPSASPAGTSSSSLATISPATPSSSAGTAEADSNPRRSFERINRVAVAVAAEKARRRSQNQLQVPHRQPLRLARQRSASEAQIDALLAPSTPRGSVETRHGVTAAQRLAAIAPDTPIPPCRYPAAPRAMQAGAEPGLPRSNLTASSPKHACSSVPPYNRREQLQQQLAATDSAGSSASSIIPPHSPFGQRGQHASDLLLADLPAAEPPVAAVVPCLQAAVQQYPAFPADPRYGNYTSLAAAGAATAGGRSQPPCLPFDQGGGQSPEPHAVRLHPGSPPTQQNEEEDTPRRRKGLLASFNRLLRI